MDFLFECVQYNEYIEYVKTSDTYERMKQELALGIFSHKFIYSLDDREYLPEASSIVGFPVYRCKHRWHVDNISKLKGSSVGYKCKIISSRPQHLKETAIILSYINNVEPLNIRLFEIMAQEIYYQYLKKPAYELTQEECFKLKLDMRFKHFRNVTRDDILEWAILYSFKAFKTSLDERNDILRQHSTTKYKLSFESKDLYERTDEELMMNRMSKLELDVKYKILDYLYKKYPHYKWIKKEYEKILHVELDRRNIWEEWKKIHNIKKQ